MAIDPLRILDSGAYSAWTQGAVIDIDAYILFAQEHRSLFEVIVNLDIIPSTKGVPPTPDQVEASAKLSWKNYKYISARGLHCMPVYHQGERDYWLHKMLDSGCDYVGISPANDKTPAQRRVWLDHVFRILTDSSGMPAVKTHGFGITAVPLLFRYPWYSVDSVTWVLLAAYGKVMCPPPTPDGLGYDWKVSPWVVRISSAVKKQGPLDYDRLPHVQRLWFDKWLSACGISAAELKDSWEPRALVNGKYFLAVEGACSYTPNITRRDRLF